MKISELKQKLNLPWQALYDAKLPHIVLKARLNAGITQEELATRMGTKQPSIARAENGNFKISHQFLKRVAEATGHKLLPPTLEKANE